MKNNIVLFGDSITEQGFTSHWVSALASAYSRRADVYNRGLSGFNTKWVLQAMRDPEMAPSLFPRHLAAAATRWTTNSSSDPISAVLPESQPRVLLATLFLGANDANKPGTDQHVPVGDFKDNLYDIIGLIDDRLAPRVILLITPPPLEEQKYLAHVRRTVDPSASESFRTLRRVREYRNAVLEVAADAAERLRAKKELELQLAAKGDAEPAAAIVPVIACVDLFRVLMGEGHEGDDYSENQPWAAFFDDGLHLNAAGGAAVGAALVAAAAALIPAESIPYEIPRWTEMSKVNII
jgi:lysophospholipase L1-like esterase